MQIATKVGGRGGVETIWVGGKEEGEEINTLSVKKQNKKKTQTKQTNKQKHK